MYGVAQSPVGAEKKPQALIKDVRKYRGANAVSHGHEIPP
jgi:hypothetical protein